ncbi:MAG: hypothetical protein ABII26_10040 [Pseudomonadota bacterium]
MKKPFKRYRHLIKCIEVVESMGCQEAIKMYEDNPMSFKELLM